VTDKAGRVSAESFRVMQAQSAPVAAAPPIAPPPAPGATARITQPKAIYKAPPVIAAGIRPRIKGTIPIDVRVQIDARGHVVSATTVTKPHAGLNEYLAARAVQAARLWRFEPARENGKAVAATQILHFVFEK
jgi:protein TonB